MFNWIKKRQYKIKNRLYIEAKYLDKADFCIGQSIKYTIDKKKRKVTISTVSYENNSTKKVAKTTNRTGVTPVIDIKTKDIKEFINSNENIELTIYKGKIILRAKQIVKVKSGSKVVELKTKQLTVCSKKFAKVVNANQISIFDLFNLDSNEEDMSSEEFKNATKPKAIKMISLFSGAGMLDKGFLDNGYDIEFACDMSTPIEYDNNGKRKRPANDLGKYHIESYKHNIGPHIIDKDVLILTKNEIPKTDIVVGGIPCTKFSKLNTKNSFRKGDSTDFPLLDKFIEVVKWSDAKAFLIENVPNFVKVKGGILLKRLKIALSEFNITYKLINARDVGSPQNRTRVFILGMKHTMPKIELPKVCKMTTVKEAFDTCVNACQQDVYGELKPTSKGYERIKHIPMGGNMSDLPIELRPPLKKFNDYCMRLNWEYSPTLTHIGDSLIAHPQLDRKLSIAEGLSLFSFTNFDLEKNSNLNTVENISQNENALLNKNISQNENISQSKNISQNENIPLKGNMKLYGSITSMYEQLKNGVDYKVSSFLAKTILEQF